MRQNIGKHLFTEHIFESVADEKGELRKQLVNIEIGVVDIGELANGLLGHLKECTYADMLLAAAVLERIALTRQRDLEGLVPMVMRAAVDYVKAVDEAHAEAPNELG